MPDIRFLLKVSRPRFWIYIFGPYIVGLAAGANVKEEFLRIDALIFGLFFLFPANLLIYGINDIFDFETDRWNPKKIKYETLVRPQSHGWLIFWIAVLNIPFIVAVCFFAPLALPSLAGFLFFSLFYSAPPIRAKQIPFLDSLFNILYVFPGAFAYQMLTGSFPSFAVLLAAGSWTMAMHAYSAIPDIKVDEKAGVPTIATELGANGTLWFCMACYLISTFVTLFIGSPVSILGLIYVSLVRYSFYETDDNGIFSVYRFFPYINAVSGFFIFWSVAWSKFF